MADTAQFDDVLGTRNLTDYHCYMWMLRNRDILQEALMYWGAKQYNIPEEAEEITKQLYELTDRRNQVNDVLVKRVVENGASATQTRQ